MSQQRQLRSAWNLQREEGDSQNTRRNSAMFISCIGKINYPKVYLRCHVNSWIWRWRSYGEAPPSATLGETLAHDVGGWLWITCKLYLWLTCLHSIEASKNSLHTLHWLKSPLEIEIEQFLDFRMRFNSENISKQFATFICGVVICGIIIRKR